MSPATIRTRVVIERAGWIRDMLEKMASLPLVSYEVFTADERNVAAAESYLRRALEALFDLARHILAKGFGRGVTEYREVPAQLSSLGALDNVAASRMREMAGYRNRLTHFYHEVSSRELFDICVNRALDLEEVLDALLLWLRAHPEKLDDVL